MGCLGETGGESGVVMVIGAVVVPGPDALRWREACGVGWPFAAAAAASLVWASCESNSKVFGAGFDLLAAVYTVVQSERVYAEARKKKETYLQGRGRWCQI